MVAIKHRISIKVKKKILTGRAEAVDNVLSKEIGYTIPIGDCCSQWMKVHHNFFRTNTVEISALETGHLIKGHSLHLLEEIADWVCIILVGEISI